MNPDIEAGTGLPIGPLIDTHPAKRPQRIRLPGRTVDLVPLDAALHADDLFSLSSGPGTESLWTYLPTGPFAERAAFRAAIESQAASSDPLFYAIIDKPTGKAVGHASLLRIDEKNRVIEVGFILYTPALQRRVGATEAMYLLAAYVFDQLGYRRYEWKCNALNAPSLQAARRLGFTYEGCFRQHAFVKGRNRDTAWFSMLDSEWPEIKTGFEHWLSPANFDVAGHQKTALKRMCPVGEPGAQTLHFQGRNLRRAGVSDVAALEKLQNASFRRNAILAGQTPIPLQWNYRAVVAACEVWLVADGDGPVAALIIDPRNADFYIESVAVAPDNKGTGLGNLLLAFAEQRAKHHQRDIVRLMTNEKLVHNVGWYQRKGYVIERIETLPDRSIAHMVKHLGA